MRRAGFPVLLPQSPQQGCSFDWELGKCWKVCLEKQRNSEEQPLKAKIPKSRNRPELCQMEQLALRLENVIQKRFHERVKVFLIRVNYVTVLTSITSCSVSTHAQDPPTNRHESARQHSAS